MTVGRAGGRALLRADLDFCIAEAMASADGSGRRLFVSSVVARCSSRQQVLQD